MGEADGLTLTVSLDRSSVAPGEVITFTATLQNGRTTPVNYSIPHCGGGATVVVSVDPPQGQVGKTWSGIAQTFKEYVLAEGLGADGQPLSQPVRVQAVADPCEGDDSQYESILEPGESVTSSMPWKADIIAGVPALAGSVPFTVSAGYDRLNDPPSQVPGGVSSMWIPTYKHLDISGAFDVVGDGPRLFGPGEVIDALLADEKFPTWVGEQPRATWNGVGLFIAPGRTDGFPPTVPNWDLGFNLVGDGPQRHFAMAFVDPFDASIILIQYCDVPCVE